jgi:hypothetical protein
MKEAAASEPNPISKRRPLKAITAVQALCNKIKRKLVRPMSQEPCLCLFSAGTPVCSVTILVSSSESLSAPSVDTPRWSEVTTKITRSAMRSSGLCLLIRASCNLFSSRQSYRGPLLNQVDALKIETKASDGNRRGPEKVSLVRTTPHEPRNWEKTWTVLQYQPHWKHDRVKKVKSKSS